MKIKDKLNARNIVERTLVPHTGFDAGVTRAKQCLAYGRDSVEPTCLAIVGESRTGKSRVLEESTLGLAAYRTPEGLVVPVLRAKVPANPTVKGLVSLMLRVMGDPRWEKGTTGHMTDRLLQLMRGAETQAVVLDEFHHFFDRGRRRVLHDVSDWLKVLVDDAGKSLLVAGLKTVEDVILSNEQLAGRFLAPVLMSRFNWHDEEDRAEFQGILEAFQTSLNEHFSLPNLAEEEMAFRFWCATGGLIGYLTKLLRQGVRNACDLDNRQISLLSLDTAYRTAIWKRLDDQARSMPFSKSFNADPTEEMIARAIALTSPNEEVAPESGRGGRRKGRHPLSQVMVAGG